MKKVKVLLFVCVALFSIILMSCNSSTHKKSNETQKEVSEVIYTCPMHPEIEQKGKGSCPDCGMALVKKDSDIEHSHDGHIHD